MSEGLYQTLMLDFIQPTSVTLSDTNQLKNSKKPVSLNPNNLE